MDVDRGVLIALGTGGSRENEIRKLFRGAKLTDDLHVVERGLEVRPIRKAQDSNQIGRCRRRLTRLLRGSGAQSKSDEEE